jgi:hypothetical protein
MSSPSVARSSPAAPRRVQPKDSGIRPDKDKTKSILDASGKPHQVHGQLVYEDGEHAGKPVEKANFQVLDGKGNVVAEGTTGFDGMIRRPVPGPGSYTVRVLAD